MTPRYESILYFSLLKGFQVFNRWEYISFQVWLRHICRASGTPLEETPKGETSSLPDGATDFIQMGERGLKKNPFLTLRKFGHIYKKIKMKNSIKGQNLLVDLQFYGPPVKELTQDQFFQVFGFQSGNLGSLRFHSGFFSIDTTLALCSPPYFWVHQIVLPPSERFFYCSPRIKNLDLFQRLRGRGHQSGDIRRALEGAIKEKSILLFDYHPIHYKDIKILGSLSHFEKKHVILLSRPAFQIPAQDFARKTGLRFISPHQESLAPVKTMEKEIPTSQKVMIDDSFLVHMACSLREEREGIDFLRFFTHTELLDHVHLLNDENPLYIDSCLKAGVRGEVVAKFLKENFGFKRIFLQTDHPKSSFPRMWWITEIIDKECHFSSPDMGMEFKKA